MSTSSPCEDTTLLSTDGGFHCIPQEEIPKNLDVKSATADSLQGALTEGLESTSQTGLNPSLDIYITDHAGVGTIMEEETPVDLINYVSTFRQDDEDKERINYHSFRDQIIKSAPTPGSNINFTLDHCFSGAGLEQLIKATPPYLSQDINTRRTSSRH